MAQPLSVLFVVPNRQKFGDQIKPCGWYVPTVSFAYTNFVDAGLNVTFCSPQGGNAPVDPESDDLWDYTQCRTFMEDRHVMNLLQKTVAIKDVDPSKFQVLYLAGGFGSMYDFASNKHLKEVIAKMYAKGAIISSVGCGAAGLLNVKLTNGKSLIKGKKVTGYTNHELSLSGNALLMTYKLQTKMEEEGCVFQEGARKGLNVVQDGQLITGQNCTSTAETARAVIQALQAHKKTQPKKGNMKALIVLTNTGVLGDGKPTGWYLPTVSYPYADLEEEGVPTTFCSPHGGNAPVDEESVGLWDHPENQAFMKDKIVIDQIKNTVPVRDINPSEYNIIHFGGGFGAVNDLANNDTLNKITAHIYENGGIVSSISNGGAGLLNVKLSNGEYLVNDKYVTAITNEELSRVPECNSVPFKIESKLVEQGALFDEGTPVKENVCISDCGRIITGQNPNSCINTAHELIKAYKKVKATAA